MYARDVRDRTLTLGVSGMLWEGNMVMVDKETESLWSQMVGMAMRGPLVGASLENIPAVMTNWRTWKEKHPDTTVFFMSRTSELYERGYLGVELGVGIGLLVDGESMFWDFGDLSRHPAINESLGKTKLLAVIDRATLTPAIYSRELGSRLLHFQMVDGKLTDDETKSTWDILTGHAVEGELKGQYLERLPGITSDAAAWSLYFPYSTWWKKASEQPAVAE